MTVQSVNDLLIANPHSAATVNSAVLTLAQSGGEGAAQGSSGGFVGAGLAVALLFGGALYAICRSSRR